MARMMVRCSAFACMAVHALAEAPLLTDLEAAVSAEGPACSTLGSAEDSCQLHLLQVRAKGLSEEYESDSPVAAEEQQNAIEAMRLADVAAVSDEDLEEAASVGMEEASANEPATEAAQGPEINSLKPATVVAESAGHCTAQDAAAMHQMGKNAFPKAVADCGRSAYKWFRFHQDAMGKCVRRATGVSAPCSQCFAAAGQYGFDNCKVQCLFGSWCSSLCRGCTSAFDHVTQECVGTDIAVPQPDTC